MIKPNIKYKKEKLFSKSLLYQNYSERYVSWAHENQMIKLYLIDKVSYNQISYKDSKRPTQNQL